MKSIFRLPLVAALIGFGPWAGIGPANAQDGDDFARGQAEAACQSSDLPALFNAMALSDAVMRDFLAETVTMSLPDGHKDIPASDYEALPIGMIDYSYVTRASLDAWEKDASAELTYVQVEFNQSNDNRWRADWTELTGPLLEGGEPEEQPQPTGRAGYLLFSPTQTCWEMTQDSVDVES